MIDFQAGVKQVIGTWDTGDFDIGTRTLMARKGKSKRQKISVIFGTRPEAIKEAISSGTAKLFGTSREKIIREVSRLLNNSAAFQEMSQKHNPYIDGKAFRRIVHAKGSRLG